VNYTSIKQIPSDSKLREYIEYYWIVENLANAQDYTPWVNSYPGTTPELLIPLHGYSEHRYLGKVFMNNVPTFYGFINNKLTSNISTHQKFILITFKSLALASVIPFVNHSAIEILSNPIVNADLLFGKSILSLQNKLKNLPLVSIVDEIDNWFLKILKSSKKGFIYEMQYGADYDFSVQHLVKKQAHPTVQ
jgi:hypothetical protein